MIAHSPHQCILAVHTEVFLQASGISRIRIQLEIFTAVSRKQSCLPGAHRSPGPVSDCLLIVAVLLVFIVPCTTDTTLGCKPLFGLKLRNFPLSSGMKFHHALELSCPLILANILP